MEAGAAGRVFGGFSERLPRHADAGEPEFVECLAEGAELGYDLSSTVKEILDFLFGW